MLYGRDARTTRSVREICQGNFFARSVIPTLDALAASSSKQPASASYSFTTLQKRGSALHLLDRSITLLFFDQRALARWQIKGENVDGRVDGGAQDSKVDDEVDVKDWVNVGSPSRKRAWEAGQVVREG